MRMLALDNLHTFWTSRHPYNMTWAYQMTWAQDFNTTWKHPTSLKMCICVCLLLVASVHRKAPFNAFPFFQDREKIEFGSLLGCLRTASRKGNTTRWWFQIFFIFTPTWGRFPFWLICFKGVETTNQTTSYWIQSDFLMDLDSWFLTGCKSMALWVSGIRGRAWHDLYNIGTQMEEMIRFDGSEIPNNHQEM